MELQEQVINHIEQLTGININTKSRKRHIVELKCVYSRILRDKYISLQKIGQSIGLGHCSIIHLNKLYDIVKNDKLIDIEKKVKLMLKGLTIEQIEKLIEEEINKKEQFIEEIKQQIREEIKKEEHNISPFFENLIQLANDNPDFMFKLEAFYNFNQKIFKNESKNL
jgi:translation elongation factor EF-G